MSSFSKAIQTKTHRERSQLASRQKLGQLEKHKDYVERAKDFHSKEKRLKKLRELATNKNPDEFYLKMINSKTSKGQHVVERNANIKQETISLFKTQDLKYITNESLKNQKKIQKLIESNVISSSKERNHTKFVTSKDEVVVEDDDMNDEEEISLQNQKKQKELESRLKRQKELEIAKKKLQMEKNLAGKGKRYKIGEDSNGLPIYKWRSERRK